ncbi:MAG: porin [Bacteroidota bacterium]|nr:porin [Bacteroidota bacterium]
MVIFIVSTIEAQDSSKKSDLTITGSADVYYKYDFGQSKYNNLTSFTGSHNSFELGMASAKLDYKTGKTEVVADLGFGKRAQEFSYNDEGILAAIKQLYITYTANGWLKFTAGSWATHVGYEVVDPNLNRNYSMSYMFTNGPFFHTGIKAEASHKANGFMIGIANPTDFKYVPDGKINKKFLLAQYSYVPGDQFKAYINYVGGQNVDTSKSYQFDLVLTSKISNEFSLGFNGTVNNTETYLGNKKFNVSKSWWGSALYVNFDPSSNFGLTLREEYFNDDNQLKMFSSQLKGGSVFASTLSANVKCDNLIFIPEFRFDNASETLFTNKNGQPVKWSANVLFALVYHF